MAITTRSCEPDGLEDQFLTKILGDYVSSVSPQNPEPNHPGPNPNRPRTLPSGSFYICAQDDEKLCGGIAGLAHDIELSTAKGLPEDGRTCEIKRMIVVDEMRGKGIGRKLVNALEERASQLDFKYIVVETLNVLPQMNGHDTAGSFYEHLGYTPRSIFGHYNEIDSVVFIKTLI